MTEDEEALKYMSSKKCPLLYEEFCPYGKDYSCIGYRGTSICPPRQELIIAFKAGIKFGKSKLRNND